VYSRCVQFVYAVGWVKNNTGLTPSFYLILFFFLTTVLRYYGLVKFGLTGWLPRCRWAGVVQP